MGNSTRAATAYTQTRNAARGLIGKKQSLESDDLSNSRTVERLRTALTNNRQQRMLRFQGSGADNRSQANDSQYRNQSR